MEGVSIGARNNPICISKGLSYSPVQPFPASPAIAKVQRARWSRGGVDREILQGTHRIDAGFNIGVLTVNTSRSSPWKAGAASQVCVPSRPQSSPRHRAPAFPEGVKLPRGVPGIPSRGRFFLPAQDQRPPRAALRVGISPTRIQRRVTQSSSLCTLSLPVPDQDAQLNREAEGPGA